MATVINKFNRQNDNYPTSNKLELEGYEIFEVCELSENDHRIEISRGYKADNHTHAFAIRNYREVHPVMIVTGSSYALGMIKAEMTKAFLKGEYTPPF